jgi:uncharacterized protein (UPF0261 family)
LSCPLSRTHGLQWMSAEASVRLRQRADAIGLVAMGGGDGTSLQGIELATENSNGSCSACGGRLAV